MKNNTQSTCITDDQLRENVKNLKVLGNAFISMREYMPKRRESDGYTKLEIETGTAMMRTIDSNKYAKMTDNIFTAGTKFPEHTHDGIEAVFVYRGRIELYLYEEDRTIIIGEGGDTYGFCFDATQPHSAYIPVETFAWAATKPPDRYWPE